MRHLGPVLLVRRNGAARQDELAFAVPVVDREADRVPELRCDLPFVDQSGTSSREQFADVYLGKAEVLFLPVWIAHVENACRLPFAGGRLSAPLRPFDQNGSHGGEFQAEYIIGDSVTVCGHDGAGF